MAEAARPSVFLSYSRLDASFVDELLVLLDSHGFEVAIDRQDLFPGEAWEPRLRALIHGADTTVCVVSPNWVASEQCVQELEIAVENGRRVIPVVVEPVRPAELPDALASRQFVFFVGDDRSFARGVVDLVAALRIDISWVREQSRLLDRAQDWASNDRAGALLLRGAALERALAWLGERRPEHTAVTPLVAEFVEASRGGAEDAERSKLRGRLRFGAVAFVAIVGAIGSAALFQQNRVLAELAQTEDALAETTLKLNNYRLDDEDAAAETGDTQGGDQGAVSRPDPSASKSERDAAWVRQLTVNDRSSRLQAGQYVAEEVRGEGAQPVLEDLIGWLAPERMRRLNASGRYNILYMLNLRDDWSVSPLAGDLRAGLDTLTTGRTEWLGPESLDCIGSLRAKLDGAKGGGKRCGAP